MKKNPSYKSLEEAVKQPDKVYNLNLYNKQLTTFPENITKLTNLQVLSLAANHLTALPESIGDLTNLQRLVLGKNQLTEVEKARIKKLLPNVEIDF